MPLDARMKVIFGEIFARSQLRRPARYVLSRYHIVIKSPRVAKCRVVVVFNFSEIIKWRQLMAIINDI